MLNQNGFFGDPFFAPGYFGDFGLGARAGRATWKKNVKFVPVRSARATLIEVPMAPLPEIVPLVAVGVVRPPVRGVARIVEAPVVLIGGTIGTTRAAGKAIARPASAPVGRLQGEIDPVMAHGVWRGETIRFVREQSADLSDEELLMILAARSRSRRARSTVARR